VGTREYEEAFRDVVDDGAGVSRNQRRKENRKRRERERAEREHEERARQEAEVKERRKAETKEKKRKKDEVLSCQGRRNHKKEEEAQKERNALLVGQPKLVRTEAQVLAGVCLEDFL
jgi:hypothetical protein